MPEPRFSGCSVTAPGNADPGSSDNQGNTRASRHSGIGKHSKSVFSRVGLFLGNWWEVKWVWDLVKAPWQRLRKHARPLMQQRSAKNLSVHCFSFLLLPCSQAPRWASTHGPCPFSALGSLVRLSRGWAEGKMGVLTPASLPSTCPTSCRLRVSGALRDLTLRTKDTQVSGSPRHK